MILRIIGLDLGQQQDYSALAMLETELPVDRQSRPAPCGPLVWRVPTLKRWPLGTPYTQIADGLAKFSQLPDMVGAILMIVIDQTGVGRPVAEMIFHALLKAGVRLGIRGVTITGGHESNLVADGQWHVPKKTLVSAVQVLLGSRRLKIEPALPDAAVLVRELETFRVKVTVAGNETFESWRERDHDDLVLAVALAAWVAQATG